MRYIYVDEAGISAKEPVTVVVGIIVQADTQWRLAETRVNQVLTSIPDELRSNFIFHAKAIWGDHRVREAWGFEERRTLLHSMMSLPRQLRMPISIGVVRRDAPPVGNLTKISQAQFQHIMAFYYCISRADKYIRDFARPEEVATVIAEDTPDIRRFLRGVVKKVEPFTLEPDLLMLTQVERDSGEIEQEPEFRISRVIDSVHFVTKEDGPLLQIADACAFGFRRYFSGQPHGEEFVQSILGASLIAEDWIGSSSASTFFWHPKVKQK